MNPRPHVFQPTMRVADIQAHQERSKLSESQSECGRENASLKAKRLEEITARIRSDPRWTGETEGPRAYEQLMKGQRERGRLQKRNRRAKTAQKKAEELELRAQARRARRKQG